MRTFRTSLFAIAVSVALFGADAALAEKVVRPLNSVLTVTRGCRMRVDPMTFGTVSIITPTVETTSGIQLRCTPNTPFAVTLDNGRHFASGSRRMVNDTFPIFTQPYLLYTNSARTNLWTSTTAVSGNSGTTGAANLTIYGRVTGVTLVFPSAYRDTVTVTVTF